LISFHQPISRAAVLSFSKGMLSTETFLAFRLVLSCARFNSVSIIALYSQTI
jgi:hypothetical protein